MANNTYVVEDLGVPSPTLTFVDDGTGIDWIVFSSAHGEPNYATLDSFIGGQPAAMGEFRETEFSPLIRIFVQGIIENARGASGRDSLAGSEGANVLMGDPTSDGPGGADSLGGGAGNDRLFGGGGADYLDGAEDDDRLFGGAGADTCYGGQGRDTVEGGAGADVVNGSSDAGDTLSYLSSGAGVRASLTYGTETIGDGGHAEGDRIAGFRDILGSDFNDRLVDNVKGTIAFGYNANRFEGRGGDDTLRLGGGADVGYGGAGSDEIEGEFDDDRLYGGTGNDDVWGGEGADRLWGEDGFDYLAGEAGDDTIRGGDQRDRIYGGDGDDAIFGDGGNDLIFANDGVDTVSGGAGDDDIAGQRGADRLRGNEGADTFFVFSFADTGDRILDMRAEDRVEFQLAFGTAAISWDNSGALGEDRARLVDVGADMELRINTDGDTAVEFRITFVGTSSVTQGQIEF